MSVEEAVSIAVVIIILALMVWLLPRVKDR